MGDNEISSYNDSGDPVDISEGEDIYFKEEDVVGEIEPGDRVEFEVVETEQGKQAKNIRRVGKSRDDEIDIQFSKEDFSDQSVRLQEELDLSKHETGLVLDFMTNFIRMKSEEFGKDWSSEVVEAIANSMISMYIQEQKAIQSE
jgi:hypothetical protein